MSLCYIYMESSYVISRLCYGELVLYIYVELLCNLQTCAMVSSCAIAKLARMQFGAKLSSCVIAKLAWIPTYANMNLCSR